MSKIAYVVMVALKKEKNMSSNGKLSKQGFAASWKDDEALVRWGFDYSISRLWYSVRSILKK